MDSNEILGEKSMWELHKVAVCYFEQILDRTPHETAAAVKSW